MCESVEVGLYCISNGKFGNFWLGLVWLGLVEWRYLQPAKCAAKFRLVGSWHCNALTDGQRWAASRAMSSSRDHGVLTIQPE